MTRSLEADHDQVSRVGPCEVEPLHDAKGYMPSLGGIETPGSFGLTRVPDVNVPECVSKCVQNANDMECVSAYEELGHGTTQTGDVGHVMDGNGEPNGLHGTISETAPAPRDAACEVHSVSCERPRRARLRDRELALKRPVIGTKPPRGWLKWRQWCEFGKHVSPCEHMRRGRCAVGCEWCSQDARNVSRRRRRARVRVTSAGIAQHEGQVRNARLTWWMARKRTCNAIDGATLCFQLSPERRGRASCKPPPWRCKAYRALARVPDPRPGGSEHPRRGQRRTS